MGSIRREGVIAGLIGATVVALWFLVVDLTTRQLFWTPAALGSALFQGARGMGEVDISLPIVIGYTVFHFVAFIAIGLVAAALAAQAERHNAVLLGAVLLFVTLETLFLGLGAIAARWLLDALNGWVILGANMLAALAMGVYLWRAHPGLRGQFSRDHEEADFVHDAGTRPVR
jgi:hypothetical protein